MKIILLRHGECSSNGRYTGRGSDIPLNLEGQNQISRSDLIKTDLSQSTTDLYSSSLRRARESAGIISQKTGLNIIVDNRIDEIDFGKWEGLNYREIMGRWPDIATAWYDNPLQVTPPGAENYSDFIKRVSGFWNDIKKNMKTDSKNIIIVSHGGVIQILSTLITGDSINNRWNYDLARGHYRIYNIRTHQLEVQS